MRYEVRCTNRTALVALALLLGGRAAASPVNLHQAYGKLPLSFEANHGQAAPPVRFLSRATGHALFLTPTEAVLALPAAGPAAPTVLRMRLAGGNPEPALEGVAELPGRSDYFLGSDPRRWRTGVPSYARVEYREVYPGIDLAFYGNQRRLEYDFILRPGAQPSSIRLHFAGAESLRLDDGGDLVLSVGGHEIRQHRPVAYQEWNGGREPVEAAYVLEAGGQVSFHLGGYDRSRPLIIDPVLSYSTYLGGGGNETLGFGIAVDSYKNAYVVGTTVSGDFPMHGSPYDSDCGTVPGNPCNGGSFSDVFVAKLNETGTNLLYSTYLGGSGSDVGTAIAVDGYGNIYLTGTTASTDFPTTSGALKTTLGGASDAFFVKLDPTSNTSGLVYSTYLGGSGDEAGRGIALDAGGLPHLSIRTTSTGLATTSNAPQTSAPGVPDGYLVKFNAAGGLAFATYLGGEASDEIQGIAVDGAGNILVTGTTNSDEFPLTDGAYQPFKNGLPSDAFVTKLNPAASDAASALVYSTYLGGTSADDGFGIAADAAGKIYVTGSALSGFPTKGAFQPNNQGLRDAFLAKLDPALSDGASLVYATYLGGPGLDAGRSVVVDVSGRAIVTGFAGSAFPVTADAIQPAPAGGDDVFVTQFNATGSALVFSTLLGGSGGENGYGVALDSAGNFYVTGFTNSTNFPTLPGSFQPANAGGQDAFVVKIGEAVNNNPTADAGPDQEVCAGPAGASVTLAGSASDPDGDELEYTWTEGETLLGAGQNLTVTLAPGLHAITLTVTDGKGGSAADTVNINVVLDTAPPAVTVSLTPNVLWPPNGSMIDITATVQARDACDASPMIRLSAITSSEPAENYFSGASFGTADFLFQLRAERVARNGSGRTYTVTYEAEDAFGNIGSSSATVFVPHSSP